MFGPPLLFLLQVCPLARPLATFSVCHQVLRPTFLLACLAVSRLALLLYTSAMCCEVTATLPVLACQPTQCLEQLKPFPQRGVTECLDLFLH